MSDIAPALAKQNPFERRVRVKIFTNRGREKRSKFDIPFTKKTKIKDVAAPGWGVC